MGKHTPGPWTFEWENDNRTWAIVKSPTGKIVANVNTESGPDIAPLVSDKMPAQANVQLIAAAPGLLAALKVAYLVMTSQRTEVGYLADAITMARAAISKAEGDE